MARSAVAVDWLPIAAEKKPVELERLQMALRDNIVTPEVKANGFGGVDMGRLDKSIDQIGRELKVDYILEGSAQREANRVRVTAELLPPGFSCPSCGAHGVMSRR